MNEEGNPRTRRGAGAAGRGGSWPERCGVVCCWLLGVLVIASLPTRAEPEQLPSVDEVKAGLLCRAEMEREERRNFARDYEHVRTRVREERNPRGVLKVCDETREIHRPQAAPPAAEEDEGEGEGRDRAYEERDVRVTAELLDRFQFEVEAREQIEGEPALRVSFRPVSDRLRARGMLERFVNRTEGTLWLKEPGMALVGARLRLMEPVSFLGGIAGAVYALEATFERAATPEGDWYTKRSKWRVDYRQFLVHRVVEFTEARDEVQRVR